MKTRPLFLALLIALCLTPSLTAQPSRVAGTRHNLSVSGPGEIRSLNETEICKFCHVPHSPVVAEPLWGHALSSAAQYRTPALSRRGGASEAAPQPDGASRLCLSCHDGTVAIGNVHGSGGSIRMSGSGRMTAARPGYIGTDLSGSHPVSLVVPEVAQAAEAADMGTRPRSIIEALGQVRLDRSGKIQCTTCHDPHSDSNFREGETPHFWVKPSVSEVCVACHELR